MSRNEQVIRVLNILYELLTRRYGISLKEIVEKYDVHLKTAQRDMNAIEQSPFHLIEVSHDDLRRYRIDKKNIL